MTRLPGIRFTVVFSGNNIFKEFSTSDPGIRHNPRQSSIQGPFPLGAVNIHTLNSKQLKVEGLVSYFPKQCWEGLTPKRRGFSRSMLLAKLFGSKQHKAEMDLSTEQHFSILVPHHTILQDYVITTYFQIWRPYTMLQTLVRDSGCMGGHFQACKKCIPLNWEWGKIGFKSLR